MKSTNSVSAAIFDAKAARAIISDIFPGKRAKANDTTVWLSVPLPLREAVRVVREAGWRADRSAPVDTHIFRAARAHPGFQVEVDFDGEKAGNSLLLVTAAKPAKFPKGTPAKVEATTRRSSKLADKSEIKPRKAGATGIVRVPAAEADAPRLTRAQKRALATEAAEVALTRAQKRAASLTAASGTTTTRTRRAKPVEADAPRLTRAQKRAAALAAENGATHKARKTNVEAEKPASRIQRTRVPAAPAVPAPSRVKGAKVEFKNEDGKWLKGTLVSDRTKNEDGAYGFVVRRSGERHFIPSKLVRLVEASV